MSYYFFEFDLETGKISSDTCPHYAVRYYRTKRGFIVDIGDGYRHNLHIDSKYWNRILKIIKKGELDKSGIKAITRGLMEHCLPEEYEKNLISAIKTGIIKEVK